MNGLLDVFHPVLIALNARARPPLTLNKLVERLLLHKLPGILQSPHNRVQILLVAKVANVDVWLVQGAVGLQSNATRRLGLTGDDLKGHPVLDLLLLCLQFSHQVVG